VRSKLRVDCQAARQGTLNAVSEDGHDHFRGSARIILV
jgi:hypothetical protein